MSTQLITLDQIEAGKRIRAMLESYNSGSSLDPSKYRSKLDPIRYEDLDEILKIKVSYIYDDNYVRERLAVLDELLPSKVSRCELSQYRNIKDKLVFEDLSKELQTLIKYGSTSGIDIEELESRVTNLELNKAEKEELNTLRTFVGNVSELNPDLLLALSDKPVTIVECINY